MASARRAVGGSAHASEGEEASPEASAQGRAAGPGPSPEPPWLVALAATSRKQAQASPSLLPLGVLLVVGLLAVAGAAWFVSRPRPGVAEGHVSSTSP